MKPSDKKPRTLVTMRITEPELERLNSRCDVVQAGWGLNQHRLNEGALIDALEGVEIFLLGYEEVTAKVIQNADSLRLIAVARGNPVNLDVQAAYDRNIPVLHAPGRNAIAAAEYTLGLILSLARNITTSDRALRSGDYLGNKVASFTGANLSKDVIWDIDGDSPYTRFCGSELYGKTLGLIGFGNVATHVATLAKAFGMCVLAYSPKSDPVKAGDLGVRFVDFDTLLQSSDVVSIHCPTNANSIGMFTRDAFSLMKPTSLLINTARAIIVDQQAIIWALENKKIAGAALDVFWFEPLPANHPLLKMENIIITPHLAGAAVEVCARHSQMIVDDVFAWMDGRESHHVFVPEAKRCF